ncbi:MAG TPA: hypothetical protein VEQ58_03180 [Polyangiaceae bacterium]|nr:hypothetical protein [Polyangiaceae bacterium]
MARRTLFTGVALLALSSVWSCNGILDNEPRFLVQGGSEAGGAESSALAGQSGTSGGGSEIAGEGGVAGAGGAPSTPDETAGAGAANAAAGAPPATCPTTADCALAVCDGKSCGEHGLKCIEKKCACPGGATSETSCSDGVDNNCDGVVDCADKKCDHAQCGSAATSRCCSGSCVDTGSDANNCQACGTKCASGKACRLINDSDGRRGHCECAGTSSLCPGYPAVVCRNETPNSNVCAQTEASACPTGQTFVDVTGGPNYCHY